MLTFCSSRTGLPAHSPLVLGEGQQNRWGQGEILDLKCRIGLTSFETGLLLTWTLLAIWHQAREEAYHPPTLNTNSLCQTFANEEKICVSFRDYDGRSDLHVGITNTNGECIFIFFLSLKSPQSIQTRVAFLKKSDRATFN